MAWFLTVLDGEAQLQEVPGPAGPQADGSWSLAASKIFEHCPYVQAVASAAS